MSFTDARCPEKLFEVNTVIGTSSSEMYGHGNIYDEVAIPPPDPYVAQSISDTSNIQKQRDVPSAGFELNLVIKYDTDFLAQFPSAELT